MHKYDIYKAQGVKSYEANVTRDSIQTFLVEKAR